jgi:hypothetical protein
MAVKAGWLKDSIAKADGYYSQKGEKLKAARLTEAQIAEWNGVAKKKAAPAPKAEEVVVEAEEEKAPAKKTTKKKAKKTTLAEKLKGAIAK